MPVAPSPGRPGPQGGSRPAHRWRLRDPLDRLMTLGDLAEVFDCLGQEAFTLTAVIALAQLYAAASARTSVAWLSSRLLNCSAPAT